MNCPYCKKSIGGYVESGSEASLRVSKGLCPHCGRAMPHGYKVDFVTSSVELVSDVRDREEARKMMNTVELLNAPTRHKRVGFHATFGAIGLFFIFLFILSVRDGRFIFVTHGVDKAILPILVSVISGVAYSVLLRGIIYRHYKKHIQGKEKGENVERALDKATTMAIIFTVISWLIFVLGIFLIMAVIV